MYLSYESKQKIDSIALKIAHLDVDPIFFLEAYMQYKAPVVLNEQELTNWWQNIKNYVKGGADAYYAGQVDIKRKYEEAKQGLNAIVNLLKAGPYKDKLDPAMEKQLIDHLEDVVGELGRADQHVDKLNDRIRQSHKEKKMYGKDVAHSQTLPDNFFYDIDIIDASRASIGKVVAWLQSKPAEQQQTILNSAKLDQRRISRKIYAFVDSLSDADLAGLVTGTITDADKKLVMAYLLSRFVEARLSPTVQGLPAFDGRDFLKFAKDLVQIIDRIPIANILGQTAITALTTSSVQSLARDPRFLAVYNDPKVKPKFLGASGVEDFIKVVLYLSKMASLAKKLV